MRPRNSTVQDQITRGLSDENLGVSCEWVGKHYEIVITGVVL